MPKPRHSHDAAEHEEKEKPVKRAREPRNPFALSTQRLEILTALAAGSRLNASRIWPSPFTYMVTHRDGSSEELSETMVQFLCGKGYLDSDDHSIEADQRLYTVTKVGRQYLLGYPPTPPENTQEDLFA